MQLFKRKKRARRPERPAPVIAKKEADLFLGTAYNFKDHKRIIAQKRRNANRGRRVFITRLVLMAAGTLLIIFFLILILQQYESKGSTDKPGDTLTPSPTEIPTPVPTKKPTPTATATPTVTPTELPKATPEPTGYYFAYYTTVGEPCIIDMESLASAWASEAGFELRYELTDAERYEIAQIVTAEAVGEPLAGKIAICQCILQASEDDNIRPPEAAVKYSYAKKRPEPSNEAIMAVTYVFDFGIVATSQPIKYFYNPDLTTSEFHESQRYIMTINNHRFYAEKK